MRSLKQLRSGEATGRASNRKRTQATLAHPGSSAVNRLGPGGRLARMPGKALGAIVAQRRCRPLTWEIASIVPLLFRSEEHTSELQSLRHLVCRLLLEKK